MHTGNSRSKNRDFQRETHQTAPSLAKVILAGVRQREWKWRLLRTDSGVAVVVNFNTGGPVLKELLLAFEAPGWEEEEEKSVCGDPQGGMEGWVGWGGVGGCCSTALCSRQALSGHTFTQVGRASNRKKRTTTGQKRWRSSLLDPVKHEHVERFPDTKAEDFKSCKQ